MISKLKKRAASCRRHIEAQNQEAFIRWLALLMPDIRKLTFAIPNGGARDAREGAYLKRQGVTPGVFDVLMSVPRQGHPGLYIEFKTGTNKLTKEQAEFQKSARAEGYAAEVCYNFDEAMELVKWYTGED